MYLKSQQAGSRARTLCKEQQNRDSDADPRLESLSH